MDEDAVRARAQAVADALVAGDIDAAANSLSRELRANMGEVVSLLPLPLTEAQVVSIAATGTGYVADMRLVGEQESVRLRTRWKERDGEPTIVEASHEPAPEPEPTAEPAEPGSESEEAPA